MHNSLPAQKRRTIRKSAVAVIGLYILLYILPLGVRPLFIPDEVRYFEIPREMIASGDWIVPRLNGIRYFEKPILGYWFNAVSMILFGENAFAVRFPSALSVGISALAIFMLGRKFAGGYTSGMLAAAIFLTSIQVLGIGTITILDSLLSMLLTVAITAFFFAYQTTETSRKNRLLFVSGAFCGLAFLTKGFLAFTVPILSIVPFMIWEHRLKEFFKTLWIPVTAAILISLPWSLMIHLREGNFWHYFFWIEHVNRFLSPHGGQHLEPFWFFIPVIIAGTLPWSFLFLAMFQGLRAFDTAGSIIRFVYCWFLFPFLFFSASSGKLLTYVLPCFAPFSMLMAIGLLNYFRKGKNKAYTIGASSIGGLMGGIAVVLAVNQVTGFIGIKPYDTTETWKLALACFGLGIWSLFAIYSVREKQSQKKLVWFMTAPIILFLSVPFIIPNLTLERKAPGSILLRNIKYIKPKTIIISDGALIRAVSAFYKRDDVYLFITPGELEYGLSYKDSKEMMLNTKQVCQLTQHLPPINGGKESEKKNVVLIARSHRFEKYKSQLPKPNDMDQYGKFVFVRF